MLKGKKITPYGDIYREGDKLFLDFQTNDFYSFTPDAGAEEDIVTWLVDNEWDILDRTLYYNDPIVEVLNFIYYNEETDDYEEVDIPCDYDSELDLGAFLLRFEVKKRD